MSGKFPFSPYGRLKKTAAKIVFNLGGSLFILRNSSAVCHRRLDLCSHKNPAADAQMDQAPANEENSGTAAVSTSVRFSEWRGLNCYYFTRTFSISTTYMVW